MLLAASLRLGWGLDCRSLGRIRRRTVGEVFARSRGALHGGPANKRGIKSREIWAWENESMYRTQKRRGKEKVKLTGRKKVWMSPSPESTVGRSLDRVHPCHECFRGRSLRRPRLCWSSEELHLKRGVEIGSRGSHSSIFAYRSQITLVGIHVADS